MCWTCAVAAPGAPVPGAPTGPGWFTPGTSGASRGQLPGSGSPAANSGRRTAFPSTARKSLEIEDIVELGIQNSYAYQHSCIQKNQNNVFSHAEQSLNVFSIIGQNKRIHQKTPSDKKM